MSLSQKIKNYLTNFSGINWDETSKRYKVELNPNEKTVLDRYKERKSNPPPKPKKVDDKEFDYTYGGQSKFNTRDVLNENEAYRDTVYTNYLGKDDKGNDKFDMPTIGYGQTLKYALAKDEIELIDKHGNKKRQSGAKWHEELDKDRKRLIQGSGSRQGKAYYEKDDPIEWRVSKEESDRLSQLTNKRYLDIAKKVADRYSEKYGPEYAWNNLSPHEQMQVYQSSYGGSFLGSNTKSGKSISKGNIYLDMKRKGINPDTASDEDVANYLDNWYKENIKSPSQNSRNIIGKRFRKTRDYYQKRNCKE